MAKTRRAWQVKAIGGRFREERERVGFSARVFAEIFLDVSPFCLSQIESGYTKIKAQHLDVAARSGMDVAYIVNGKRSTAQTLERTEAAFGYATIGARVFAESRPLPQTATMVGEVAP